MKLFSPLVVASHNAGKVREIEALLAPFAITVHSASALGLPEPEETGATFEENAALKARACALGAHMAALADDSGLAVPALDGAPGIYSARWAGPEKNFTQAMNRIAHELREAGHEPSGAAAYFVCALALSDAQGNVQCVRGEIHGTLQFPPRGTLGFGYDPIFIPQGYQESFAEISLDEKQRIGHRGRAFAALLAMLKSAGRMSTRLLALAASTRADSLNKRLLAIAAGLADSAGAQVTVLDYARCDAPFYRDDDAAQLPPGAAILSTALQAHDGLLLAMPEYNWSIPAALKNLIDWLSVDEAKPLCGLPVLLMCASPSVRGGISGLQQLNVPLAHLGAMVYPQLVGVGEADVQLGERSIAREKDHGYLNDCVQDFVRVATRLKE